MLLFVGVAGSGKSSLLQRLLFNSFQHPQHRISKMEQSVRIDFPPAFGSSSGSISEDDEEGSLSSSTGSASGKVTKLARIDVLEQPAAVKEAIGRGSTRKLLVLTVSNSASEQLQKTRDLAIIVHDHAPSLPLILVATHADEPSDRAEAMLNELRDLLRPVMTFHVDSSSGQGLAQLKDAIRLFIDGSALFADKD